jgi:cytochrome bd ubiquinol oxidase subunit II
MSLGTFWFVLVAVLWTGFLLLEGFDFGVGMLAGVVGGGEPGRRTATSTIGPFWDGNEVWLVVAVAATFAAFPGWYATMFSAAYLLVFLLVVSLIVRGIALEFRSRSADPRWHRTWDRLLTAGSLVAPLMTGIVLGNLLSGLPIGSDQEFSGNLLDLLHPYPLLVGVTFVLLCLLHGATFLTLRTTGEVRARSATLARRAAPGVALVVLLYAAWTHATAGRGWFPGWAGIVTVVAIAAAAVLLRSGREAWAFAATAVGTAGSVGAIFADLYPTVMVSSTKPAYDLTIATTAAGSYSLEVMTVIAAVLLPLVLAYTIWTYVVLRRRLSGTDVAIPAPRQPAQAEQPEATGAGDQRSR